MNFQRFVLRGRISERYDRPDEIDIGAVLIGRPMALKVIEK